MKKLLGVFLQGLAVVVPIGVTIYVFYWLCVSSEYLLKGILKDVLGDGPLRYRPGMGIFVGVILISLIGLLTHLLVFRRIVGYVENLFERIPVVKSVYGGLQDLMAFFDPSKKEQKAASVVVVDLGEDRNLVGLVTRQDFHGVPDGIAPAEDSIAVYLPMSYQVGGFTVFIPRDKVHQIDMKVEDAMRFTFTAGMSTKKRSVSDEKSEATNDVEA